MGDTAAADLEAVKLNVDSHLLLDQPLLRMPQELARKNFKAAQLQIERGNKGLLDTINKSTNSSSSPVATLDSMITRMTNMKRKLESLHNDELAIQRSARARLQHLNELQQMNGLADVKYDEWSRVRLNRLLVDYLLRNGYEQSARELAKEKGIEELVDLEAFVACHKIENSLLQGRTQEALNWCRDNAKELKKINSTLEFELRLQQYIELVRTGDPEKLMEATLHARKYFTNATDRKIAMQAAGLLAYPPNHAAEPYATLYSSDRWTSLRDLFVKTHYELFNLAHRPLLHIALSAGLSALKTPSCHSVYASSSSNASSSTTTVCPICSTELNELARNVPYAHHSKSHVESDPVVLPNGRIYGRERLVRVNEKLGTPKGMVRDPTDITKIFDETEVKKVFIM